MKKLWIIIFLFTVNGVYATQTKYVNLRGSEAFSKGEFDNVQLDTQGNLSLGSPIQEVYDTKNLLIQFSAKTDRGVYFSTAKDAGLFFYDLKTKETKKLYENPQSLSIPSFAIHGSTLYFIESPSNTLYSLDIDKAEDTPQKIREIHVADYIWQLGISGNSLYFSTGAKAALYELSLNDLEKTPKKVFENLQERHFLTMRIFGKTAYLGGEGLGGIYKVRLESGKTDMIYKTYEGSISDILLDDAGNVFVSTANKEPKPQGRDFDYTDSILAAQEQYQLLRAKVSEAKNEKGGSPLQAEDPTSAAAGLSVKNSLYQIQKNGTVDKLFTLDNTGLNTLFLAPRGKKIFVGTSGGRVFQFDKETRMISLQATLDDEDVTNLVDIKDSLLVMTSNIGQIYSMGKTVAKTGKFTSDIIDLGNAGILGETTLEGSDLDKKAVQVWVRGGQTSQVDGNWSAWKGPLVSKSKPKILEKVHYLQYKVEIHRGTKDESPTLNRILTAYLPDNKIPSISLFSVFYDDSQPLAQKQNLQIHWNATDADKDQLIYRVYFKQREDVSWSLLLESPSQDKTVLDTRVLPDGLYQFKLEVSDELDNGKSRAGKVMQLSSYILINNTPPTIKMSSVKLNGASVEIHAKVSSETALIGKVYYKLGVESNWVFVEPDSRIYDNKTVNLTIRIPKKDLKDVENFLFIRAFDMNMNQISSRLKLDRSGKKIS